MNKTPAEDRAYLNLVSPKELPLASERFREGTFPSVFVHFRLSRDWTKMQILDSKGFVSDCMRPGKTWLQQFIHPDDRPHVNKIIKSAIRTKRVFILEHRFRRPDGSLAWFFSRAVPVLDEEGKIVEWRGATNDVTESVEALNALAAEEAKYRAVVETSIDGFWMADLEGRILMVNNAYVQRSGYSRKELLRMTIADLEAQESPQDVQIHIERVIRNGSDRFETEHRTKDGKVWPVEISTTYLAVGGGLFFVFTRDMTERMVLEKGIVDAASSEQERIAHELHDGIGQQLTAITLIVAGLQGRLKASGRTGDAATAEEIRGHIQTAITNIRTIVRGLVPIELECKGLCEALSELTTRMAETTSIAFHYRASRNIVIDQHNTATHLYRIAQEAIQNAIKHADPKHIDVCLEHDGDHLVLTVSDDGNGIDRKNQVQGGFGVHIMKNRCNTIGGLLSIEPRKKGGTIVRCKVPLNR